MRNGAARRNGEEERCTDIEASERAIEPAIVDIDGEPAGRAIGWVGDVITTEDARLNITNSTEELYVDDARLDELREMGVPCMEADISEIPDTSRQSPRTDKVNGVILVDGGLVGREAGHNSSEVGDSALLKRVGCHTRQWLLVLTICKRVSYRARPGSSLQTLLKKTGERRVVR